MATLFVLHEVVGQEKVKPIDPFPVLTSFGLQTSHKCPPLPICDADHTHSSTCIHQLLTCVGSAVESLGWHWEGYSLPFGTNELRNEPFHLVMPLFFFFFFCIQGLFFSYARLKALVESSLIDVCG